VTDFEITNLLMALKMGASRSVVAPNKYGVSSKGEDQVVVVVVVAGDFESLNRESM
jgi:hypothetical protein